jgi:hypothetical protein
MTRSIWANGVCTQKPSASNTRHGYAEQVSVVGEAYNREAACWLGDDYRRQDGYEIGEIPGPGALGDQASNAGRAGANRSMVTAYPNGYGTPCPTANRPLPVDHNAIRACR